MLFSGHAEGKLDPSGRIQISSQFKNEPDKLTLVVFTDSDAGCVKIYTEEGNRKSQEQLYRNISDRLTFVSAIRKRNLHTNNMNVDAQGRGTLPAEAVDFLRKQGGQEGAMTLLYLGVMDHIEVYSADKSDEIDSAFGSADLTADSLYIGD
jgi:DNA-binding transcriptional regulator/RsmH inhibitor MraZ